MAPGMMIVTSNNNVSNWNLETGYSTDTNEMEYPIRSFAIGEFLGIDIVLSSDPNDYQFGCQSMFDGFKVALNVPGEVARIGKNFYRISNKEYLQITLKGKVTTTSEGLRSYSPSQRRCFFDSERKLRFFKIYTQNNCEVECLANLTMRDCGCVKFSLPSKFIISYLKISF